MFSEFFIKRPIFATVLSAIIIIAGIISIKGLPIEEYPEVIPPQVSVMATYTGANAETISKTVAAPLEQQINGVENMMYMSSTSSSDGSLTLDIYFKIGTNIDDATINVNNRVQMALSSLPTEVQTQGVTVTKQSSNLLLMISLLSPKNTYDELYMANYATVNIVDKLKRVTGVGNITLFSDKEYSMRIWLKPDQLVKYNLTPTDVLNAISEQNSQFAIGRLNETPSNNSQAYTYTITTQGRLDKISDFEDIILKSNTDGSSLKLKNVAKIELGSNSYSGNTTQNSQEVVPIGINLQSGANAVQTAKLIKEEMKEISLSFPNDITYNIPYDTTSFIQISINEVIKTFIEALLLVIIIVYLFLQNIRATIIPIIAIPISIIGTFAGMYLLGYSINLLTLFGLVLAVGIVVDDAIIVIENVERHMSEGMSPREASFKAMKEVSGAIVAIVLVLSSVFIPVAFMGGLTGEMYRQFAITIVISIVISGFVALTLTPSLCASLLKDDHKKPTFFFFIWFNNFFEKATSSYTYLVKKTIRFSLISILLFGGLIFISYDMFKSMKTGLVPNEDQGTIFIFSFNPGGASISRTDDFTTELNSIILKDSNVKDIITLAGYDLTSSSQRTHAAATIIKLKPWDDRPNADQHADAILKKLSGQVLGTSDGFSFGVLPPPIMGMSIAGGFEMYIQDRTGGNIQELEKIVNQIIAKAKDRPELMGVRSSLAANIPQYKIDVNVPKAKAKGVAVNDIYNTLNATFGSFYVNDFSLYGRTYKVNLQAESEYRKSADDLKFVFVKGNNNELLPISSFVNIKKVVGADLIERFNLFQAAKVSGQPSLGYSSGDALKAIEEVSNEILPAGYTISWVGTAYQEKQISSSSSTAFIFGLVLLFLILAALYGKWLLPISVVLAVPFAMFGAILATLLRGLENDIYFQIGLLVLAGLAAKNAILIVEFALQKQKEGFGLMDAAFEAAKIRLRPIIMTSLAFTLGTVPLAISNGAGAASRHAIGTGVIGGMLAATFIAIIFIPLFYVLVSKIGLKKDKTKEEI